MRWRAPLAAVLVIGCVTAFAVGIRAGSSYVQERDFEEQASAFAEHQLERLRGTLEFDGPAEATIRDLLTDMRRSTLALDLEVQESKQQVLEALADPTSTLGEIEDALELFRELQTSVHQHVYATFVDVRDTLPADQREAFVGMMAQTFQRRGQLGQSRRRPAQAWAESEPTNEARP